MPRASASLTTGLTKKIGQRTQTYVKKVRKNLDSDYIYRSVHTVDDARLFNRASMGFIQNLLRKLERCFFYDPVSSDPAARGDNLVLVF